MIIDQSYRQGRGHWSTGWGQGHQVTRTTKFPPANEKKIPNIPRIKKDSFPHSLH